jgi:O-antigen/teichoic acid export membrane protein
MLSFWSINELALPLLSRLQTERDRHREAVYSSLRVAALICVPLFGGLALTAAPLVELLFGAHWLASTAPVQLLALASIPKALMAVGGQIFTSLGNPRRAMHISALTNPLLIVLVTIMAPHGITAAALAVLLTYCLSAPLTIVSLCREVGLDIGRLAREQAPIWIAAAAMAVAVQGLRGLEGPAWSALVRITVESGVGAVAFAVVLTMLSPRFVLWLIGFARAGLAPDPRG